MPSVSDQKPDATRDLTPAKSTASHGNSKPKAPKALSKPAVAPNRLSAREAIRQLEREQDPFWLNAKREVDISASELEAQHNHELHRRMVINKVIRGSSTGKLLALTFDDGPHPDFTPRLLDILKREGVHATFFLVGSQAEQYPDLVRQIAAEGHTVGNHTYHHVSLPKIPLAYVDEEIQACGDVLESVLGFHPRFFRPPGGRYDRDIATVINRLGYTLVLWTDNPGDFEEPGSRVITSRTLTRLSAGGIILLHDGVQQTVDALPGLIETMKARGYRFVTLDQVVEMRQQPSHRTVGKANTAAADSFAR